MPANFGSIGLIEVRATIRVWIKSVFEPQVGDEFDKLCSVTGMVGSCQLFKINCPLGEVNDDHTVAMPLELTKHAKTLEDFAAPIATGDGLDLVTPHQLVNGLEQAVLESSLRSETRHAVDHD